MNHHGEHVVLASHDVHIVEELSRIHIHTLTCKHTYDVILQSLEIHLDIGDYRVVCTCGCPIAAILFIPDSLEHRIRIEHA